MSVHSVSIAKYRLKNLLAADRMTLYGRFDGTNEKLTYIMRFQNIRKSIPHIFNRYYTQRYTYKIHGRRSLQIFINHIKQQYHIKDYKFGLIISVVAISVIGIMMVGSAKPDFMTKQIMGVILGFGAMVVVSLIDYKWIMKFFIGYIYVINLIHFDRSKNSRIRSFGKRGAKMDQPRVYAASAFRLDKNTSY